MWAEIKNLWNHAFYLTQRGINKKPPELQTAHSRLFWQIWFLVWKMWTWFVGEKNMLDVGYSPNITKNFNRTYTCSILTRLVKSGYLSLITGNKSHKWSSSWSLYCLLCHSRNIRNPLDIQINYISFIPCDQSLAHIAESTSSPYSNPSSSAGVQPVSTL